MVPFSTRLEAKTAEIIHKLKYMNELVIEVMTKV
jgi:hypothetical protein